MSPQNLCYTTILLHRSVLVYRLNPIVLAEIIPGSSTRRIKKTPRNALGVFRYLILQLLWLCLADMQLNPLLYPTILPLHKFDLGNLILRTEFFLALLERQH